MLDPQTRRNGLGSGDDIRDGEDFIGESKGKNRENEGNYKDQKQVMG
jgi:hypothetical protein